jgi:hypothetical protein
MVPQNTYYGQQVIGVTGWVGEWGRGQGWRGRAGRATSPTAAARDEAGRAAAAREPLPYAGHQPPCPA